MDQLSYKQQQEKELEALRERSMNKKTINVVNDDTSSRDTFVPVLAVISLMGLFGLYGLEMVRLYLKGELYLPWD